MNLCSLEFLAMLIGLRYWKRRPAWAGGSWSWYLCQRLFYRVITLIVKPTAATIQLEVFAGFDSASIIIPGDIKLIASTTFWERCSAFPIPSGIRIKNRGRLRRQDNEKNENVFARNGHTACSFSFWLRAEKHRGGFCGFHRAVHRKGRYSLDYLMWH